MTRKNSNVKALALAVTCAILAGGGIGLEPVYAGDVAYDTNSYKLQNDGTDIGTLTVGNVTIHGIKENEKPYGITIGDSLDQYVNISNHDVWATGAVHASIIASGLNARIENGKVVAQNGLYIGYDGTDITEATYDNSRFAVNGENGSFKAANGKFTVSDSGVITADSLALTGTDGTTNVGAAITANANNIKAVNGQVTNIKNDVNSLQTTTGQLQTKVGELTTSDTAARNDIISLQKKTAGISGDGNEITTNSLKLRGSGSLEEQEITAAKVKGYDEVVAAVGDTSTEGTLAYNTQKIEFKKDNKVTTDNATYIDGITHAGGVRLADGAVRAKSIVLEEEFANGTFAQATLTRESIVNLHGMTDGTTKIKVADGSEVGGVTFNQGKVTNVVSINDNLKFESDGIYLNKGDSQKQIKFSNDGKIIIGTSSSAYDTNGFYAGGDDYNAAKAAIKSDGSLKATKFAVDGTTGNTTVGGTLGVTGKTTLSDELQVDKTATFGTAVGSQTVINGGDITADGKLTSKSASIGTVGITDTGVVTGITKLTAKELDVTGSLNIAGDIIGSALKGSSLAITGDATIGGGLAVTGNVTGAKINGATITATSFNGANITNNTFNGVTLTNDGDVSGRNVTATGTINGAKIAANSFNDVTMSDGNVTAKTITGTTINDGAGASMNAGTVRGNTLTDGNGFTATGGKVTAKNIQADTGNIAGVKFAAGGSVSGISNLTATTIKDGAGTIITGGNVESKTAKIGAINIDNETIEGSAANGLSIEGVKIKDGVMSAVDSIEANKATIGGVNTLDNNGLTVKTGSKVQVGTNTVIEDGSVKVSQKTSLTDQSLQLNDTNKWTQTGGLVADKATVNGIALGTDSKGKATFGKDAANQTTIDKGKIKAKAEDNSHQQAGLTFNENGLTVSGQNAEGKTSSFSFNAKTGANTFTGQDGTFTTINGSSVRSYNSATGAGHLNGATLNLWKDNDNSTYMTAGGATFNGAAGEKGGKTTTINGGTITTDTLNVERINLGGELYDKNGTAIGGNLSMDKDGNFSAAGGNFTVKGGTGADKGAFTNKVGNTTLKTDNAGASMKFDNTAADGGVESKVTVEANKATVAAGEKASFVATTDNGGTATITGGTQTVTTTDKGTVFENSAHKTAFVDNGATNTIINGNEITTGKITTDQLVITGQGNAHGNGSIAFGGNGTIKSDINDGQPNGKNTSFETTLEGVNTKVTNGTTTTENKVTAAGNSNTVTDDTHKSEFNQGLTSIGGVVTNGTVKIAQTLDGQNGNITNEVTDKDGKSSKLVQNGTGLEYTDSANAGNATRINSSDVSIGSATDDSKRINLSDLGQIDELDKELTDRDEYKNNPTAVGVINAEAAIRREEVARLDGRINDVNDRVNKVGAMAAAIASLKSIGYDPQAPSEFSIGLGQYKGETGVAMGFFHYPNKNFMINVSLSTAGGETMGGIGATWRFGHKSPQKLLEEQREAQAKKELAAAEKYQAAAKLAKEAQERAEYAAKLARQAQVSADNAKAAADAT